MKKILLFMLLALFAAPCFASKNFKYEYIIHFEGNLPLSDIDSEKGTDIYQYILPGTQGTLSQSTFTLEVSEDEEMSFEEAQILLFGDINERNKEGTYVSEHPLIFTKNKDYAKSAYLTHIRPICDENGDPETISYEIKRIKMERKRGKEKITFYTFSFEQKLQGSNVVFKDTDGSTRSLPPQEYFEYMVNTFSDSWIDNTNGLTLELFNK